MRPASVSGSLPHRVTTSTAGVRGTSVAAFVYNRERRGEASTIRARSLSGREVPSFDPDTPFGDKRGPSRLLSTSRSRQSFHSKPLHRARSRSPRMWCSTRTPARRLAMPLAASRSSSSPSQRASWSRVRPSTSARAATGLAEAFAISCAVPWAFRTTLPRTRLITPPTTRRKRPEVLVRSAPG
jgi:hypothetical protein